MLEYKFAFDELEPLLDGSFGEITWNPLMKKRVLMYDETDISLSTENDKSGNRSITLINDDLPRGGQRSTRGSNHVTAGCGTNMDGEMLWQ